MSVTAGTRYVFSKAFPVITFLIAQHHRETHSHKNGEMLRMQTHLNKLDDEYQIVDSATGDVVVNISKKLSNAWYLTQACTSLLLLHDNTQKQATATSERPIQ
jgi:hypothetical protein